MSYKHLQFPKDSLFLVTGGAGYIGSHCALALLEQGKNVVVFDNLSTGHIETIETLKQYGNLTFIKGDLQNKEDISKVFLDPARMGAEEETLKWINGSRAKTVVYMSCEPTTLARDLKILKKEFEIKTVETYDMFPYTNHIETLVCLQRRGEKK